MKIKQTIFLILLIVLSGVCFYSCDPEEPNNNQTELIFTDLTSDKDSIDMGETITFIATATGEELSYEWMASAGVLLGSGNEVTYSPSPCIFGDIIITCTVKDKFEMTKSKEISVFVRALE